MRRCSRNGRSRQDLRGSACGMGEGKRGAAASIELQLTPGCGGSGAAGRRPGSRQARAGAAGGGAPAVRAGPRARAGAGALGGSQWPALLPRELLESSRHAGREAHGAAHGSLRPASCSVPLFPALCLCHDVHACGRLCALTDSARAAHALTATAGRAAQRFLLYARDELAMAALRIRVRALGERVKPHEVHFKLHAEEVPVKNKARARRAGRPRASQRCLRARSSELPSAHPSVAMQCTLASLQCM